jgi:hypothetical protein
MTRTLATAQPELILQVPLSRIAHGRSGDKGSSANISVIAYTKQGYDFLCERLTAQAVEEFFKPLGLTGVVRFELPNLNALNFVLEDVLDGGGSRSLRVDAQGKTLGQALLEMEISVPEGQLPQFLPPETA